MKHYSLIIFEFRANMTSKYGGDDFREVARHNNTSKTTYFTSWVFNVMYFTCRKPHDMTTPF